MDIQNDKNIDIKPWCVKIIDAAKIYPHLLEHIDDRGKIDLGDPIALIEYNKAVALYLANLRIEVPHGKLIPAICLRFAYVKILAENYLPKNARILEIGTGSSAMIALIAAAKYNFNVVATEIDQESLISARNNVNKNKLQNKITLVKSDFGILSNVVDHNEKFDGLLVNPPYYPSYDSIRYKNNSKNERGFRGSLSEMIGGGLDGFDFVKQLISEATSKDFNIELITLICYFQNHALLAVKLLKNVGRHTIVIKLKVGTRKRFLIIGKK